MLTDSDAALFFWKTVTGLCCIPCYAMMTLTPCYTSVFAYTSQCFYTLTVIINEDTLLFTQKVLPDFLPFALCPLSNSAIFNTYIRVVDLIFL